MLDAAPPLADLCRELAIRLTERPSVTGTADEASFGSWLAATLAALDRFGASPEVWTFPVAEGDARLCVAMLVRGAGEAPGAAPVEARGGGLGGVLESLGHALAGALGQARGEPAVLLTGHYDTVTTADYGDLQPLATAPEALATALLARLEGATGAAEALAREDLASGRFLPGRGLLDMKAGLAAGLAAMAAFAADPEARGALLFVAVPDEENASAGARAAGAALAGIARARGLDLRAAINLDAIADSGDGAAGRVVALGTVGKVLPTAFVVGAPVHSGFPLQGLNAAVLAGAIAQALEWAPALTDEGSGEPGTPVSLLSLKDGKAGYDVTTPGTAFATWSVLNHRRDPAIVLDLVEPLVREALGACVASLRERAARSGQPRGLIAEGPVVPVMRWGALLARVREAVPGIEAELDAEAARLRDRGASLPEIAETLTAQLWRRSGLAGPAVVLGLGSTPYLATGIADARLRGVVEAFAAEAPARHGASLRAVEFFAGISDMSFFGEADAGAFARLAADTPGWGPCVGLHAGSLAQVPTVNLGPWGRDYHTPLERIEADYGFRVLPGLLLDLATRLLAARA
jgi:arginine utilization protein RocB